MLTRLLADMAAAEGAKLWRSIARLTVVVSLVGLAVAAALSGLIFAFLGAYLSLAEVMKPWQAGALVGSAVMLIAIILLVIVVFVIDWQKRTTTGSVPLRDATTPERGPSSRDDSTGLLGMSVGDMLVKSNIKTTDIVLSALVAGMVLGASPHLRQWIFGRKREDTKGPPAND